MKKRFLIGVITALITMSVLVQPVFANCAPKLFGLFNPWYAGLTDGNCNIKQPGEGQLPAFIWTIILNVLSSLSTAAVILTVGYVVYGGFTFIASQGDPGKIAAAKKTLTNAVIGLAISLLATVIINTIIKILTVGM